MPKLHHIMNAVQADQVVPSVVLPPQRCSSHPENGRLLDLMSAVLPVVRTLTFPTLDSRTSDEEPLYRTWPGEHHALLAAIVKVLQPKTVIEIGTFTGMSALAMAEHLPADGRLFTFDVVEWKNFGQTWFTKDDFASGRLTQVVANLADNAVFERYRDLIAEADLIFLDGPKDIITERSILSSLDSVTFKKDTLLLADDIKWPHMIEIWHELDRPKLDVTSFGHWCGTGLMDWRRPEGA